MQQNLRFLYQWSGEIGLRIDDTKGLQIIVSGKMIEATKESIFNLEKGIHNIIFITDRAVRESNLKVQLFDVGGSPGRASLIGGGLDHLLVSCS